MDSSPRRCLSVVAAHADCSGECWGGCCEIAGFRLQFSDFQVSEFVLTRGILNFSSCATKLWGDAGEMLWADTQVDGQDASAGDGDIWGWGVPQRFLRASSSSVATGLLQTCFLRQEGRWPHRAARCESQQRLLQP